MASRKIIMKKLSNECHSSNTMDIVIDDQSLSDSVDDDCHSRTGHSKLLNIDDDDDEHMNYRQQKSLGFRNPKSHRLIEKRRRDRLNRSLAELLDLIPHKKPENQRRIEKIEIIEMAIKHMRTLISSTQKIPTDEKPQPKIDTYRLGYQQGTSDTYEFVEQYSENHRLQSNLSDYIQERENELNKLTVVPEKKFVLKTKSFPTRKVPSVRSETSTMSDDLCLIEEESDAGKTNPSQPKVPSFVLHPSGTHYIPVCIDASIVAYAFQSTGKSSCIQESLQCHPVSIPVNFHPNSTPSDSHELEIQNINVIASRHQTSVRPN